MNGKITYCEYNNEVHGAYLMNINTNEQHFIPNCVSIKLLVNDEALLGQHKKIEKINLKTMNIESSYYIGEPIDYFTLVSDNLISFSSGRKICIFDLAECKKTTIVEDNATKYHSWRKGNLIYTNTSDEVLEFNLTKNASKKLFDGREPIVSSDNNVIAYKALDGKLNVFNFITNKRYVYNGSAYYYCFSPEANMLLIEDEMKLFTSLKNLMFNGKIIGHCIFVWDYENHNKTYEVLNECTAGAGEGFSWK